MINEECKTTILECYTSTLIKEQRVNLIRVESNKDVERGSVMSHDSGLSICTAHNSPTTSLFPAL